MKKLPQVLSEIEKDIRMDLYIQPEHQKLPTQIENEPVWILHIQGGYMS